MKATPIVALDVAGADEAMRLVDLLGERCRFYKIGSELFTAAGPDVVRRVRDAGCDVFLDLKFHDIPNTVRGGVRAAARLGARLVTVHASGGRAMLRAAADEAASAPHPCTVLAVSVLTSLGAAELGEAWGRGGVEVRAEVLRLADLAREAGVGGLVCSGEEVAEVRRLAGPGFELLVPGIRLAGGAAHDQSRVTTPAVAAERGATYLVIGRAVTGEADPADAMRRVVEELR